MGFKQFLKAVLKNREALNILKNLAVSLKQYDFATDLRERELELYQKPQSTRPWEEYLMILGERNVDYKYTTGELSENLTYFKKCWEENLSCYKALEMFHFHLEDKNEKE
jgi:hypothetical protein